MYVTIWEFTVRAGAEPAFERLYGPDGAWAALFRQGRGYVGTELLSPTDGSRRYLTVDRWRSAADYAAFNADHGAAYHDLDAEGEAFTQAERHLGDFVVGRS